MATGTTISLEAPNSISVNFSKTAKPCRVDAVPPSSQFAFLLKPPENAKSTPVPTEPVFFVCSYPTCDCQGKTSAHQEVATALRSACVPHTRQLLFYTCSGALIFTRSKATLEHLRGLDNGHREGKSLYF